MIRRTGGIPVDLGIARDTKESLRTSSQGRRGRTYW